MTGFRPPSRTSPQCAAAVTAAALVVLSSAHAAAAERGYAGFEAGLRSGVAFPFGESSGGRDLSDELDYRVPIWVDIGYRFSHSMYFGLYAQAGVTGGGEACREVLDGEVDALCTFEDWRLGLQLIAHPLPEGSLPLWIGAGLGVERVVTTGRFTLSEPDPTSGFAETAIIKEVQLGPNLLVQLGMDFPAFHNFEIGPFVAYTGGIFTGRRYQCPSTVSCPDDGIDEKAMHHWISIGARGTFGP